MELKQVIKKLYEVKLEDYVLESELLSVVIGTYNRCPFRPGIGKYGKNPLEWTIHSLKLADHGQLREVIVVDDSSNDFTENVVERLSNGYSKLTYLCKKKGYKNPFEHGVHAASGRMVKIQGDDHWVHPYNIDIGTNLLSSLRKIDDRVRVLQGPCYERATQPSRVVSCREIGRITPFNIKSNFDCFPAEYMYEQGVGVLKSFETTNLAANRFCYVETARKMGLGTGNILDGGYGVETLFAINLRKHGFRAMFCPDPRFSSIHFKFGSNFDRSDTKFAEYYGLNKGVLIQMYGISRSYSFPTGTRKGSNVKEDYLYKRLRNFGAIKLRKFGLHQFLIYQATQLIELIHGNTGYSLTEPSALQKRLSVYLGAVRDAIINN